MLVLKRWRHQKYASEERPFADSVEKKYFSFGEKIGSH
jgi:hypothetical protein